MLTVWILCLLAAATCGAEGRRPVLRAAPTAVKTGNYVVVLRRNTTTEQLQRLLSKASKHSDDAKIHRYVETVAKAFTVKLSPYSLELLRRWPEVDYIEEEHMAYGTQSAQIPWHLDRIDQRPRTFDNFYQPIATGAGVDVYIVDCGINYLHEEFENRASYAGYDAVDAYMGLSGKDRMEGRDCFGHGTHVASLCGGKKYGSAKGVNLLSMRALDCSNFAPWSVVLDALDYIARVAPLRGRRAIVSMSLAGDYFQSMNDAVQRLYALNIPVVVAASNGGLDACTQSPASSPYAITVGATRSGDGLYVSTSFGSCVTLLSPGQNILGADFTCNNCSKYLSGTSMATPIVSGVAAMLLQREPSLTPAALKAKLVSTATVGAIDFTDMPARYRSITPNKLLYVPGSCGGVYNALGKGYISSPNSPDPYPGKISCMWTITGPAMAQIQFNVTFVSLESPSDTLKVCLQPSCSGNNLLATLTGDLGNTSLVYFTQSIGASLWLQLRINSTNSGNRKGFKANYIKFYARTTIIVPDSTDLPATPPQGILTPVISHACISVNRADIAYMVSEMANRGYKVVSLSSYRFGYGLETVYDVIFSNSTLPNTVPYIQLTESQLLVQISQLSTQGYSVSSISSRVGTDGVLYYSGVFKMNAPIIDTLVYLGDSVTTFLKRLKDMQRIGYQLVAQSLEVMGKGMVACSVYTRDIRVAYNISIDQKPLRWISITNATFYEFTDVILNNVQTFVPVHVDSYFIGRTESVLSAVLVEKTPGISQWFRWGMNDSYAEQNIREQKQYWDLIIAMGYSYNMGHQHYLQWQQKSPPEYTTTTYANSDPVCNRPSSSLKPLSTSVSIRGGIWPTVSIRTSLQLSTPPSVIGTRLQTIIKSPSTSSLTTVTLPVTSTTVNRLSSSSQTTIKPLVTSTQTTVSPVSSHSQTTVKPLVMSPQTTASPVSSGSQTTVKPLITSSQTTVMPLITSSQTTVVPLSGVIKPSLSFGPWTITSYQVDVKSLSGSSQTTFSGASANTQQSSNTRSSLTSWSFVSMSSAVQMLRSTGSVVLIQTTPSTLTLSLQATPTSSFQATPMKSLWFTVSQAQFPGSSSIFNSPWLNKASTVDQPTSSLSTAQTSGTLSHSTIVTPSAGTSESLGNVIKPVQSTLPSSGPFQSTSPSSRPVQSILPSSGPVQSILPSSGPVRSTLPSSGPVQSTLPSSGPVQSTLPSSGPVRSMLPSSGPVQSTLPSSGPLQSTLPSSGPVRSKLTSSGPVQSTLPSSGPLQSTLPSSGPVQSTLPSSGPVQSTLPSSGPLQSTLPSSGPLQSMLPSSGPPQSAQCYVDFQLLTEVDGKNIESVVADMLQKRYKVVSITSYHSGPTLRASFDVLFSNSSLVDTVVYIQITEDQLLSMIKNLSSFGYSLWTISDRVRNFGNVPYYSGVFGKNAATVETKVYLRDNMATFQSRLKDMQNKGYQLVAQSVEKIGQTLEACSVYRRDGNSTGTRPSGWQSIVSDSYSVFVKLNTTSNLVPTHIDTYYIAEKALFSVVLSERTVENQGQWIQWGLSSSSAEMVKAQKPNWEPCFSLGYIYPGSPGATAHYVQWRKARC